MFQQTLVAARTPREQVVAANQPKVEYIKYTPNASTPGHNPQCTQRIIRLVEAQKDPLEPPKFKHKRLPRGPPEPPVPVLHSPPRKLTAKDQAEWRIPPCVSNWKNQKGYTIPLDKRLQADGRSMQEVVVNERFALLSEALYIAERNAREEIRLRNELLKQKKQQEELVREKQLRELAARARIERANLIAKSASAEGGQSSVIGEPTPAPTSTLEDLESNITSAKSKAHREEAEFQRRRELERELRLKRSNKKNRRNRDEDRDISEVVALGQSKPTSQEGLFDSRLFNQSGGLDSGFSGGDEVNYEYDKPLFTDRSKTAGLYRFDRTRVEQSLGTALKVPAFAGADPTAQKRTAPVEFEKLDDDPFGLASLIESSKKPRTE